MKKTQTLDPNGNSTWLNNSKNRRRRRTMSSLDPDDLVEDLKPKLAELDDLIRVWDDDRWMTKTDQFYLPIRSDRDWKRNHQFKRQISNPIAQFPDYNLKFENNSKNYQKFEFDNISVSLILNINYFFKNLNWFLIK